MAWQEDQGWILLIHSWSGFPAPRMNPSIHLRLEFSSGGRDQSDVEPSWEADAQGQVHQAHRMPAIIEWATGHAALSPQRATIVLG